MSQKTSVSIKSNRLISNRYQLQKLIGIGGMGEVFLANDTLLGGTLVAIKFLTQTVTDPKIKQDFAREAMMSAALSQKTLHIVRAYDCGVSAEGKPFYVMEYLNGQSLRDLMPLPLPRFLHLTRQICLGLQSAHEGILIDGKICPLIHRDIKPANILVVPDSILGELVKILDFGIAKFVNYAATVSTNKGFHGTLPYSSPEQLEGEKLDNRSDIYSLGVLMFEMLTNDKPWQPETDLFGAWYKAHHFEKPRAIAEVCPQLKIPRQLHDLIMNCLAKKPGDRPQNIRDIIQVLDSIDPFYGENLPPPDKLTNTPKNNRAAKLASVLEQHSQQFIWPKDKPIQEIVFPLILNINQSSTITLWLMLPSAEIKNHLHSRIYNRFIFMSAPHPMLLWITLLYSEEFGAKWLPCYLDMQNNYNRKLVSALAEHDTYPLIGFTLEPPHSCTQILISHLEVNQRHKLKLWVEQSRKLPSTTEPHVSKNLLKQQYKQIQAQILQKIA